jgi:hypothetical protein
MDALVRPKRLKDASRPAFGARQHERRQFVAPRSTYSGIADSAFLVDIPPASGRSKQDVMLFGVGAAAMTRRVRALKRASGAGLENRPCSAR